MAAGLDVGWVGGMGIDDLLPIVEAGKLFDERELLMAGGWSLTEPVSKQESGGQTNEKQGQPGGKGKGEEKGKATQKSSHKREFWGESGDEERQSNGQEATENIRVRQGTQGRDFEWAVKPGDGVNAGSGRGVGLFTEEPVAKDGWLVEPLSYGESGLEENSQGETADDKFGWGLVVFNPESQESELEEFEEFVESGEGWTAQDNWGEEEQKEDEVRWARQFEWRPEKGCLGGFKAADEPEEEKSNDEDIG